MPFDTFDKSHVVLQMDAPRKPYSNKTHLTKPQWRQRQWLLNDLHFLLRCKPSKDAIVIYVNAGRYGFIHLLAEWLDVTFHCYCTNGQSFDTTSDKIVFYNEAFSDRIAQRRYIDKEVYFFVHEPLFRKTHSEFTVDKECLWKSLLVQKKWVELLKPTEACLYFQLPWQAHDEGMEYLDGYILFQPYVSGTSTETCLQVKKPLSCKKWSTLIYEEQLFYHNSVVRQQMRFNMSKEIKMTSELQHDWDSHLESLILFQLNMDKSSIASLSNQITKFLNRRKQQKKKIITLTALREC